MKARWTVPLLVVGLLVPAALLAGRAHVEHEVTRSSGFCSGCHEADVVRPVHPSTGCTECHAVPEEARPDLYLASLGGEVPLPHSETAEASCERCHDPTDERFREAMHSAGHREHAEEPCTSCHGLSLHGPPAPEEACLHCHGEVTLLSEPSAESDCVACHLFAPDDAEWAPEGGFRERVGVDQVHGAASCERCHNPHEPPAAEPHGTGFCTGCHRGELVAQVAGGPEIHRECRSCHDPHPYRDSPATECQQCHAAPLAGEEQAGWVRPDGAVAVRPGPTSHDGRCQTCHRPHDWSARRTVCNECHLDEAQSVASMPPDTHEGCLDCHDQHAERPTSTVCSTCHEDVHRGGPAEHRSCTSCHDAHAPRRQLADSCARCHGEERQQVTRSGPGTHRSCLSCHQNHGDPLAVTADRCATCHAVPTASLARAQAPVEHVCTGCHRPHQFAPAAAMAACTSCHDELPTGAHTGQCSSCHDAHQAPASRVARCASCHEDVHPQEPGHRTCNGCHAPHRPAEAASDRCSSCHAAQARAAATWPRATPHREQCAACHVRHDEGDTRPCAGCHQDRVATGHAGPRHERCEGCHAPHRAPPATAAGWWQRCAGCHQPEADAARAAAVEPHRECAGCHDPLSAGRPSCTNCHDVARQELHSVAEHRDCSDCHVTHGTAAIGRSRCEACHEDRTTHHPDATACHGCHTFTR